MTAFGQTGPYAHKPGFGTLAEAMSGLAAMSGEPDGAPLLPPFPMADAFAGLHAACATLIALRGRDKTGVGQSIDVAITEAMMASLGAQLTVFEQLGVKPARLGNASNNNAPRNVYRCRDGRWLAVSAPADSIAERDAATVLAAFEQAQAAVAPIYDVADIVGDPHFKARRTLVEVPDEELGTVAMPDIPVRFSATPGRIRWAGPRLGEHTDEVLGAWAKETGDAR